MKFVYKNVIIFITIYNDLSLRNLFFYKIINKKQIT